MACDGISSVVPCLRGVKTPDVNACAAGDGSGARGGGRANIPGMLGTRLRSPFLARHTAVPLGFVVLRRPAE